MTETKPVPCAFPQFMPSTSYVRGCRCGRCKGWKSSYDRQAKRRVRIVG